jgi:PAS domain-containing protein
MMGSPIRIPSRHPASAVSLHIGATRWRWLLLLQGCGLALLVLAGVFDIAWLLLAAGGLLMGSAGLLWRSVSQPVASSDEVLQREQELQQIEQLELKRYRQLVQFANDIFTWHAADGSVQYISPNVRRLLGYESQELLGQNLFRLIHPDDLASVHLARADLLAEGAPLPVTFRIDRKSVV